MDRRKWQVELMNGQLKEPRMREVGAHFIDLVGGPRKFAQMLKRDYRRSEPGSLNRSRIMALIVQTLKTGRDDEMGDTSGMTEEDLQRELGAILGTQADKPAPSDTVRPGGEGAPEGGAG